MKNVVVRAFVFTLVLTGFAASAVASHTQNATLQATVLKGGPTPAPTLPCGPNDPQGCGWPQ